MNVPVFGLLFVPVALWIFFAKPHYMLALLVVSSIFGAASVFNLTIGSFVVGVQPYFFVAGLLAVRTSLGRGQGPLWLGSLSPQMKKILSSLALFWAVAFVGSFVLPVIFRGAGVIDPRAKFNLPISGGDVGLAYALYGKLTPLQWGFRNLGEAAYLTLNAVVVFCAAAHVPRRASPRSTLQAVRWAIVFAALVVIAQAASAWAGWSFPYGFFANNPAYSHGFSEVVAGLKRSSSTFIEASYAGGYLAAGALALIAANLHGVRRGALAPTLAVVGCVLTTASTGFVTLLAGGGFMAARHALKSPSGTGKRSKSLPRGVSLTLGGTGIAVAALLAMSAPLRRAMLAVTVHKLASLSAFGRLSALLYSAILTVRTYGLGTGLGSNRPFDLLTELLSNVGVIGTLLFATFFFRLVRELFRATGEPGGASSAFAGWMLLALVIAQLAAIPDINWPPLWAASAVGVALLEFREGGPPRSLRPGHRARQSPSLAV